MKRRRRLAAILGLLIALSTVLSGCSVSDIIGKFTGKSEDSGPFVPTGYSNEFSSPETLAEGIQADFGHISQGTVGFQVKSEKKIVVQVCHGDLKYNYHVAIDGSVTYVPVQLGDGSYQFRVLQNSVDTKYIELASKTVEVKTDDEFAAFLRPNMIVNFNENSECVKVAAELASKATSEKNFIKSVYEYMQANMSYDDAFANAVTEGYIPDPDKTLRTGTGICFDFASLTAAMLRSQGIPTKLITGYVGEDGLYHAWNSMYLKSEGWVSAEFTISKETWALMDVTFATIGKVDNTSYVNRYIY